MAMSSSGSAGGRCGGQADAVLLGALIRDLTDSTELLVSEMVTNAVQVSREMSQAAIRLWLVSDRAQVLILAWDASPLPPVQANPDDSTENGRGLLLVDAISDQWGLVLPQRPHEHNRAGSARKGRVGRRALGHLASHQRRRQQWRH
jgi:hypothetical protein